MLERIATGIVFRNPKPHLRAVHAWHPTLVRFDDGELLAGFDLGQAVESLDYRTWLSRSSDEGQTWSPPVPLLDDKTQRRSTHSVRLGRTVDGLVTGFGGRYYRDNPELGLTNRDNLGFVPMDLLFVSSRDRGRTWEGPAAIPPPLVGPAFEVCHAIVELSDGRWLAPTATWKGWDGQAPNGMKAVALVSHDRGRNWPEYVDLMDGSREGIIYWENSLVQLPDGRLLVVAWAFDEKSGRSRPNAYSLSNDGRTFSAPRPTGFHGQTAKLVSLGDGRLMCFYRRDDQPGLWANLVRIAGDEWQNLADTCVWRGAPSGMTGQASNSDELSALKFGYPTPVRLSDGSVLVVFWCVEECIGNIRWARLRASS